MGLCLQTAKNCCIRLAYAPKLLRRSHYLLKVYRALILVDRVAVPREDDLVSVEYVSVNRPSRSKDKAEADHVEQTRETKST